MKRMVKRGLQILITLSLFGSTTLLAQWQVSPGGYRVGGTTIYYTPGYYNPYYRTYLHPYRTFTPSYIIAPTNTINACPLKPSYYDASGNWVPPTRVC